MKLSSVIHVRSQACFLLLIALCFISCAVPCVTAVGLQKIGTLSNGPSFDLVESNGYLYAGQGSEVVTYDVSDSTKMSALTWKSALSQLPVGSSVKSVSIDDGYLYIAASSKFIIADISNPASPEIVSILNSGGSDVLIKGTWAYLLSAGSGVKVIDISSREAPRIVTTVRLAGKNLPWRGTIDGNYLYVGLETDNRLDILDISTPSNPFVAGSYSPATTGINYVSGVAVKNGYAYITEYHNGVRVIDVSNPAQPSEVMNKMGINANDIKILGDHAYVSVRYQGFDIFDISNPRNITLVGKATDAAYYNEGIFPTRNYTFISLESLGFGIYDTSLITKPITLARVQVVGGADSVIIRDSTMYIGAHNDGIWTVDISNPSKPEEIAFISNLGRNVGMDLAGNNLYVAGAWSSLSVINVSNATDPRMVLYHFGTSATSVLADGNYVYTDQGIIDMTTIKSPVYVSKSQDFAGSGVTKFGNNYLVVASSDGLHIIDVSNKQSPVTVTTFEPGVSYADVKIHGNVAVAAVGNSIVAIDLSDTRAPKRLSQLTYSGIWYARALAIHDTIVYAAGYGINDVRAFDISDPAQIKLVGSIDLGGNFGTISYDNGYLAVGGKMATYILSTSLDSPVPTPTTPVPTPTPTPTPIPTLDQVNAASIKVSTPRGGEKLERGSTRTITWDYKGSPGTEVKIVLVKAGVEVDTISPGASTGSGGRGSYAWPIPSEGATGDDYKVSIQSISHPSINDMSNKFTITTEQPAHYTRNPPTAQFMADVTEGKAPLAVQFTDKSVTTGTAMYKWKFIDEDGIITNTSTEKNPSVTFTTPGNKTVKLTVNDANGSDSEIKTNYITIRNPFFLKLE